MHKVTISDVARESGVSTTTISRFLNGKFEYMSDSKRAEIESVIGRLNYTPSATARSLKSKRTGLVGILISITGNSLLISQTLQGLTQELTKLNLEPILYNTTPETEKAMISRCISQNPDGVIVSPTTTALELYDAISEANIPMVLIDRFLPQWKYDAVYVDHATAVHAALENMYAEGYHSFYYFTTNTNPISTKNLRRQAFEDFLKKKKIPHIKERICRIQSTEAIHVMPLLQKILSLEPGIPKAVFASDSEVLFLLLDAAMRLGITFPGNLGLGGYDSWGWASFACPEMTAVVQPKAEVSQKTVQLLQRRIKKHDCTVRQVGIPAGIRTKLSILEKGKDHV